MAVTETLTITFADADEDGWIVATIEPFGVASQGRTRDEARAMVIDALNVTLAPVAAEGGKLAFRMEPDWPADGGAAVAAFTFPNGRTVACLMDGEGGVCTSSVLDPDSGGEDWWCPMVAEPSWQEA